MKEKFTIEYFLEKFQNIPAHEIGFGHIKEKDILHHCGMSDLDHQHMDMNDECTALAEHLHVLFPDKTVPDVACIYEINDATNYSNDQLQSQLSGMIPKERIIYSLQMVQSIHKSKQIS